MTRVFSAFKIQIIMGFLVLLQTLRLDLHL